jgi:hypothetical protein
MAPRTRAVSRDGHSSSACGYRLDLADGGPVNRGVRACTRRSYKPMPRSARSVLTAIPDWLKWLTRQTLDRPLTHAGAVGRPEVLSCATRTAM